MLFSRRKAQPFHTNGPLGLVKEILCHHCVTVCLRAVSVGLSVVSVGLFVFVGPSVFLVFVFVVVFVSCWFVVLCVCGVLLVVSGLVRASVASYSCLACGLAYVVGWRVQSGRCHSFAEQ